MNPALDAIDKLVVHIDLLNQQIAAQQQIIESLSGLASIGLGCPDATLHPKQPQRQAKPELVQAA